MGLPDGKSPFFKSGLRLVLDTPGTLEAQCFGGVCISGKVVQNCTRHKYAVYANILAI